MLGFVNLLLLSTAVLGRSVSTSMVNSTMAINNSTTLASLTEATNSSASLANLTESINSSASLIKRKEATDTSASLANLTGSTNTSAGVQNVTLSARQLVNETGPVHIVRNETVPLNGIAMGPFAREISATKPTLHAPGSFTTTTITLHSNATSNSVASQAATSTTTSSTTTTATTSTLTPTPSCVTICQEPLSLLPLCKELSTRDLVKLCTKDIKDEVQDCCVQKCGKTCTVPTSSAE